MASLSYAIHHWWVNWSVTERCFLNAFFIIRHFLLVGELIGSVGNHEGRLRSWWADRLQKKLSQMQLFINHCIYWFTKICLQRRRLVIDVICTSIQWREGPFKCVQKSRFYRPVDYVKNLMLSCVWLWAIVKLIKRTDFLCKSTAMIQQWHLSIGILHLNTFKLTCKN